MKFEEPTLASLIAHELKEYRDSRVVFICRGSKEFGLGHLYRSVYLAKDLWMKGIKTAFNAKLSEASTIVIDLPRGEDALKVLNSIGERRFIVLFDNDDTLSKANVDILVYPDFIPVEGVSFKAKRVLTGWNFVYPPSEIRRLKELSSRGEDVLVTFGGADPKGFTREFLYLIREYPIKNRYIHVIFGPLNSDYEICSKLSLPPNIRLYRSVRDPSFLYERSSIVLSSGGLSFAYSVFLNRFTIGVPQNEMEKRRIEFYSNRFKFVRSAFSIADAIKEVLKQLEDS